jgi:sigma-B regulation protein RsbU (phosphoserine phosphatase)
MGIDPADDHSRPSLDFILPGLLAECFETERAMVWPLRARGGLLGALMVQYVPLPVLGRRLSILDGIAHQLALALENARLAREVVLQHKLERDIELGRDIQASFLPKACPIVPGWELCSFWQAARQVGGDFYDFIPLRSDDGRERWGLVMADVADKGVAAALFMALSRTLMRSVAISRIWPATTLARVNELIFSDAKTDMFVTVLYAVWEPDTGILRYVIAGHNPPVWVGPNRAPQLLPGRGVALGVFDEVSYQEHELQLSDGEALLLYTDGLPDAVNTADEEFGTRRVMEVMQDSLRCRRMRSSIP